MLLQKSALENQLNKQLRLPIVFSEKLAQKKLPALALESIASNG
jgi:hypothetical protein